MRSISTTIIAAALGAGLLLSGDAAHAQLLNLESFGACIDHPETDACRARFQQAPPPPAPPPAAAPAASVPTSVPDPAPKPAPKPAAAKAAPLDEILGRIKAGKASAPDMEKLEEFAGSGDPRATEVFAWCYLNGRGRPVDPMRAYFLYGRAAELKVPNARQNQILVFEEKLTTEQRNEVLLRENARR
jgi:TPR repeat protein